MKVISKIISRNEFISRKNGVIPSLVDEWKIPGYVPDCVKVKSETCEGDTLQTTFTAKSCCMDDEERPEYIFSSYQSAVAKANELGLSESVIEYTGKFVYQDHNYGLIVSDIIIPNDIASKVTDYTDFYVNIPDGKGGYYDLANPIKDEDPHYEGRIIYSGTGDNKIEVKILTYTTLNKWYSFFKEYKRNFKPHYVDDSNNVSDAALYFYKKEYDVKNDVNRKRFSDIDDLYEARGGDAMYNWIEEYCMPHDINEEPKETFTAATYSATYNIPILITNSIDDLGQMSIFSSKWEAGVDYHNRVGEKEGTVTNRAFGRASGAKFDISPNKTTQTDCTNPLTETISIYLNDNTINGYKRETFLIKSNTTKGYFNNEYYENEFYSSDWINYTDWRINNHPEEFESHGVNEKCIETYAYSPINGEILYNPDECDATETIPYEKENFIISNGDYVKVIDGQYVVPSYVDSCYADLYLKRRKKLPVINDGASKYVELNGKKFYAIKEGNKEVVYFTKSSDCHGVGSEVKDSFYIMYNDELILVDYIEESGVKKPYSATFEDNNGNKVINVVLNGYFYYRGSLYYILNGEVVVPKITASFNDDTTDLYSSFVPLTDEDKKVLGWNSVTVNNDGTVSICHKLDIKRADIVTGYTNSKLDLLRRRKINVDEVGNELPGYLDLFLIPEDDGYVVSLVNEEDLGCEDEQSKSSAQFTATSKISINGSHYNTPYNQCVLDLLYKVGEVSEIEFQKTVDDVDLYNGNYLETIELYHLDDDNKKIDNVKVKGDDTRPYLRLYEEPKYDNDGDIIPEPLYNSNNVFIGNVGDYYNTDKLLYCDITYYIGATLKFDEESYSYVPVDDRHKGVKYIDTLMVTKLVGMFFMSDGSSFTYTYYELRGPKSAEHIQDFNDVTLTSMSYFEMQIMNCYSNKADEFDTDYWENNNGLVASPVFRNEYDIWSSTPQNVKGDIYIDRGISAAFERHLKLEEVRTLDALINYGNGYFKINKD